MKTLTDLFAEFPFEIISGSPSGIEILSLVSDSRKAQPGSLFIALTGENKDGHQYILDAIAHGAVAVVGEKSKPANLTIPYLQVRNSRQALAHLAAAFTSIQLER